jgi:hypothetical protein
VCCDLELIELVSKMESIVSSCGPELGVLFGVTIWDYLLTTPKKKDKF